MRAADNSTYEIQREDNEGTCPSIQLLKLELQCRQWQNCTGSQLKSLIYAVGSLPVWMVSTLHHHSLPFLCSLLFSNNWVYPDRVSCNGGSYSGCYSKCDGRYSRW